MRQNLRIHCKIKLKSFQITKKLTKKHPPISNIVRHNDHHFIIMDKAAGMPVQPDRTEDMSLLQLAEIYCKRRVHAITRLDRPVSGLNLFGKIPDDVVYAKGLMKEGKFEKMYIAIVEGKVETKKGQIENFLYHNARRKKAEVNDIEKVGYKKSILEYELLKATDNYSILKINLITGRFHQIRAQLSHIGFPIKGDVKYGARRANKDRSIHLTCYSIKFKVKASNKEIHSFAVLNLEDKLWSLTNDTLNELKSK